MGKYIAKRVLATIPVLLGMILMIFFMLNVVPGDPVTVMMREHLKEDVVENLRRSMHLDDPFFVRYLRYVWDALRGDLGVSWKLSRPVTGLIAGAFPCTCRLAISAALFSWIMGIPVGVLSAVKKNSLVDHLSMGFSLFGVSMPVFWVALILQNTFKNVLPVSGVASWKGYILPTVVLGWSSAGRIARLTRSNLLEVMRNDYIRTARAKGVTRFKVIFKHALKNSLTPVITYAGPMMAYILTGSMVVENIFSVPGLGRLFTNSMLRTDYMMIMGVTIFLAATIIFFNFLSDILYKIVDPRIDLN